LADTVNGVPVYRDSAGVLREQTAQTQITDLGAQLAAKADTASIPKPATATPMAEKTGAAVGQSADRFAREDHQHPRLTSTTYASLAADGTATVAFTRSFVNKPGINITETDVTGKQPLVCSVQSWVQDTNGAYTGCVIKGQRAQPLPTINPLAGTIALLSALLTGVNTVFAQLTGYNIFGGSASGASVSVIAIARSDVPAA